jgi:hypothetical protein
MGTGMGTGVRVDGPAGVCARDEIAVSGTPGCYQPWKLDVPKLARPIRSVAVFR